MGLRRNVCALLILKIWGQMVFIFSRHSPPRTYFGCWSNLPLGLERHMLFDLVVEGQNTSYILKFMIPVPHRQSKGPLYQI